MTSNYGMESLTLETRLRIRAIKIWVLCDDMDGIQKNPREIKIVRGFNPVSNAYP